MFDNIFTTTQCVDFVTTKLGHKDFELSSFSIKPISENKIGYLGDHLRLTCEIKCENKPIAVQFFVKKKLGEDEDVSVTGLITRHSNAFEREAEFLTFVFKEHPDTAWAPKLYGFVNDCIVVEDLSDKHFELTKNEFEQLDLEHCQMGLATLAKLHAFCFQYRHKKMLTNPGYSMLDEFGHLLNEAMFHKENEFGRNWMEAGEKSIEFLIDYTPLPQKLPKKEIIEKYRQFAARFCEDFKPKRMPYNVICHGDLWANNLMFKYINNHVKDCCLVDFQMIRFLPPTQDVLMFLHINTMHEFRVKHLQDLFEFYYNQLSDELDSYGLSIGAVFPKREYEKCLKEGLLMILNISVTYKTFMSMDRQVMNGILANKDTGMQAMFGDRSQFIAPVLETDEVYRMKICNELQELIDALFVS